MQRLRRVRLEKEEVLKSLNNNNMTFEEAKKMTLDFHEWEQTSQIAADFWRRNFISPTMDGSHHQKVREATTQLFEVFMSSYYPRLRND
jgi:hypothetical protein